MPRIKKKKKIGTITDFTVGLQPPTNCKRKFRVQKNITLKENTNLLLNSGDY